MAIKWQEDGIIGVIICFTGQLVETFGAIFASTHTLKTYILLASSCIKPSALFNVHKNGFEEDLYEKDNS